jgi:hypothetical protein
MSERVITCNIAGHIHCLTMIWYPRRDDMRNWQWAWKQWSRSLAELNRDRKLNHKGELLALDLGPKYRNCGESRSKYLCVLGEQASACKPSEKISCCHQGVNAHHFTTCQSCVARILLLIWQSAGDLQIDRCRFREDAHVIAKRDNTRLFRFHVNECIML